jgi:hypothetical protein
MRSAGNAYDSGVFHAATVSFMISTWEETNVYSVDVAIPARDALASDLSQRGLRVDVFADAGSFQRALVASPCDIAVIDRSRTQMHLPLPV